ncbi:MerR family transcriptional regulator [Paenibacillus hemerocallicola]|uniref:MerR family transcriptional regulator n=1 Tax=Paenibacillus hemerocallicola TaxID=1172614 RepID=A0A5C4T7Q0_9BACL|nr:MerR family transcriptional regulator [Paenibacillus hemerocallicola]TNJ64885.1 MerR family transcriptional regulator [Paenibacillus hemerocallicola]
MYTIGQVVEMTGFGHDTLRYYEKIGLLKPQRKRSGGARVFSDDDLRLLSGLKCLKRLGMSLEEIKSFTSTNRCVTELSSMRDGDEAVLRDRIGLLTNHLARMETQRRELDELIDRTKNNIRLYNERLDGTP